jgi:hypothetical protein
VKSPLTISEMRTVSQLAAPQRSLAQSSTVSLDIAAFTWHIRATSLNATLLALPK